MSLLLGYDIGSSSIKATLLDAQTGAVIASAVSPQKELAISAPNPGWAEQEPDIWWENVISATHQLNSQAKFDPCDIKAIGISYQMHGLVAVDKNLRVLRPAIIWCDSRAVQIGEKAASDIGEQNCLNTLLNLPGNFTTSKLKWVMENEPELYSKIHKIMLPGDYIAMKMTGQINTTPSGLSEAILWDFKKHNLSDLILDYYGIDESLIPDVTSTFSIQGELTKEAAKQLQLKPGTKISYRVGDQPNNALSLNVLEPGEIAATAGTSGVVYGITDKPDYDSQSRVNTFVHVNNEPANPKYGVLLCVNGTGILNSWLKHNMARSDKNSLTYEQMNELAATVSPGSQGLFIFPYGNGAERTLNNKDIGASVYGWNFNIHKKEHFFRAAQEGIIFALNYGLQIMRKMQINIKTVRAGNANMFLSPVFSQTFADVTSCCVELYNTDGSQGAARGAGIGAGIFKNAQDAFANLAPVRKIEPDNKLNLIYQEIYKNWENILNDKLHNSS